MHIPISTFGFKLFFVTNQNNSFRAGPYKSVGPAKAYITRQKKFPTSAQYVIYEVTEVKEYEP